MKDKISIIVPCYNVEKYIVRCVKSIIKCLNGEAIRIHPYYKEAFESWKDHFYSNKSERNKLTDSGNWKIKIKYEKNDFLWSTNYRCTLFYNLERIY